MAEFIPTGIGGFVTRGAKRKVIPDKGKMPSYNREEYAPPPKQRNNIIPSQEVIESLLTRALAALAKGIYWDRGSIINIVL